VGGVIRFLAFAVLLVALLVFVVAPAVASPVLSQMVRDMGLAADDVEVTIETWDPSLLAGRSQKVRVQATNAIIHPATIRSLDLVFGQVSFFERSFQTVRGDMSGVVLTAGGLTISVSSVSLGGPANEAQAAARMSAAETEALVHSAAQRAGIVLDDVRFGGDGLRVTLGGLETGARVDVAGGALVLTPEVGPPVVLLQPAPPDPWRLTEAYVTADGITVNGVVDAQRLTEHLPGAP
jgi:hypothetical protein